VTSRERVVTSLNHRSPDRVPIDFSGHRSSGIAAIAYVRLRDFLGLAKRPIRVYDPVQQLAIVDDDVLDRFCVDTIELGRGFAGEDRYWADWVLPDGTPCQLPVWLKPERDGARWVLRSKSGRVIAQMPDGALYFEQTYYPFADGPPDHAHILEAFDDSMWNSVASPPGPIVDGEDGVGYLRTAHAGSARGPTARSSDFSGGICWKPDRCFTGTIISSCFSPEIPALRMIFWTVSSTFI
jgi:uroporphyrinogen decarboxylase